MDEKNITYNDIFKALNVSIKDGKMYHLNSGETSLNVKPQQYNSYFVKKPISEREYRETIWKKQLERKLQVAKEIAHIRNTKSTKLLFNNPSNITTSQAYNMSLNHFFRYGR
jgi:hypothetical protein